MNRPFLATAGAVAGVFPLLLLTSGMIPAASQAGPLIRRAEERRACQEFAGKLQAAGSNTAQAQQIYQQGVLQLVARFGENPCGSIPAPVAAPGTTTTTAPATVPATAPVTTPATPAPASSAPQTPAATPPASGATPSAEQRQACSTFAARLQQASAAGGAAEARQAYAMGTQKLSGMFGPNPCPGITPPP